MGRMVENTVRDRETGLRLTINLNDHPPPHAHVYRNQQPIARIELETLRFLRPVPTHPNVRRRVREATLRHRGELLALWNELHG